MFLLYLSLASLLTATKPVHGSAQSSLQTSAPAQNSARLKAWQQSRFGMFIHWGPVSLKGTEIGWSRGAQVPIMEYDSLYMRFNPLKFDADAWVKIAQAAGMKYIVFTTKHHDGFCMFNTQQTDYNIMNSPFSRDVVKDLAAACRRQHMPFGCYYSVTDWHHPDFPLGSPGGSTHKPHPNLDAYEQYLRKQVAELIHNYGPLNTIWFDVPQEIDTRRGAGIVEYVRSLQPDILINNRCNNPGDYDTPEQTIGRFQNNRPWESCITICNQWSNKPNDPMKSLKECVQTLVRCAGGDGNLLFNVGPTPEGLIEPRQADRLAEMGTWLKQYGKTIYGTRGGPFRPSAWGCSTSRGKTIYLHIMKWEGQSLSLPPIPRRIKASRSLTGRNVTVHQDATEISLSTNEPTNGRAIDDIVQLDLDGDASTIAPVSTGSSLTLGRPATASNVFKRLTDYSAVRAVDGEEGTRWATDGSVHAAWLEVDLGRTCLLGKVRVSQEAAYASRIRRFELQCRDSKNAEWQTILTGTTIGTEYLHDLPHVSARWVRLNILEATIGPTINEFELFPPK